MDYHDHVLDVRAGDCLATKTGSEYPEHLAWAADSDAQVLALCVLSETSWYKQLWHDDSWNSQHYVTVQDHTAVVMGKRVLFIKSNLDSFELVRCLLLTFAFLSLHRSQAFFGDCDGSIQVDQTRRFSVFRSSTFGGYLSSSKLRLGETLLRISCNKKFEARGKFAVRGNRV